VPSILKRIYRKIVPLQTSPLHVINGKDVIFIHINKTGGTSVLNALNLTKSHLTAKEIIEKVGRDKYENAYKFAAVRNPWDKALSHYKYRIKTNQTNLGTNTIPFKEWLKDNDGKININEIMKFENLNSEFLRIAATLELELTLPHLNKTNKVNYREFYDEESKDIIGNWFTEDIRQFGYDF
jgi:chondroitin 4-sulfotransferase 11